MNNPGQDADRQESLDALRAYAAESTEACRVRRCRQGCGQLTFVSCEACEEGFCVSCEGTLGKGAKFLIEHRRHELIPPDLGGEGGF